MNPTINTPFKLFLLSIALVIPTTIIAAEIPWASSPEEVGMSTDRLEQIEVGVSRAAYIERSIMSRLDQMGAPSHPSAL